MGIRNKRPDLNGTLNIDKPLGWSSAKVCNVVRRLSGGAKVGHAGTLDPLATGVLVVCLGKATKQISGFMEAGKEYRAEVDLSAFSTTDDAEGERTIVEVASVPTRDAIDRVLREQFLGEIEQAPPRYSAVKIDGQRAYKMARAGEDFKTRSKVVRIDSIEIDAYTWPALTLTIACGKGTYIRSIARDLGSALGTGGMLTGLVRTRVGAFELSTARSVEDLPQDPSVWSADLLGA
ncbi:MAG: tRNA pseudouridine(55) synthase TruB [Phycisphaerales bacterium JB065]